MRIGLLLAISLMLAPPSVAASPDTAVMPVPAVVPPVVAPTAPPDPVIQSVDSIQLKDWIAEPASVTTNVNESGQFAAILREYRIQSIIHKRFSRTQRLIDVYIYSFANPTMAFGAYSSLRTGSGNVVVRGDMSSEDDQNICFLKGTRYVWITSSVAEDDMSKQAASSIADQLAPSINEHADPGALFSSLPFLDRMRGTERVLMGPLATRKFISLPYAADLRLENARIIFGADYQFPHPEPDRAKAIVIFYPDARTAASIYADYCEQVGPANKSWLLSDSMQMSKLKQTYLLYGHVGSKLFVISGARHKLAPVSLARQFMAHP